MDHILWDNNLEDIEQTANRRAPSFCPKAHKTSMFTRLQAEETMKGYFVNIFTAAFAMYVFISSTDFFV